METKFTKGEWGHYYPAINDPDIFTVCIKNDPYLIAKVPIINGNLEEAEANAKLISAASNLLQALEKCLLELKHSLANQGAVLGMSPDQINKVIRENNLIIQCEEAIKKAIK